MPVLYSTDGSRIYEIDVDTGTVTEILYGPITSFDFVVASVENDKLFFSDHEWLRSYDLVTEDYDDVDLESNPESLAIDDQYVYVGVSGWNLIKLDFDLSIIWEVTLSGYVHQISLSATGDIYAASGSSFSIDRISSSGTEQDYYYYDYASCHGLASDINGDVYSVEYNNLIHFDADLTIITESDISTDLENTAIDEDYIYGINDSGNLAIYAKSDMSLVDDSISTPNFTLNASYIVAYDGTTVDVYDREDRTLINSITHECDDLFAPPGEYGLDWWVEGVESYSGSSEDNVLVAVEGAGETDFVLASVLTHEVTDIELEVS